MIIGLDHIHLRSADPVSAAAFYVSCFGAAEASRSDTEHGSRVMLRLGNVGLFIDPELPGSDTALTERTSGLVHFGLKVADLAATIAELQAKGVKIAKAPVQPRSGLKIAFILGPDGVEIELLERAPNG